MRVVVVTPPDPLVDLDTAKSHLRVDGTDDDALITAYIAAVCGNIDGPDGWLRRAIGLQTLELQLDSFYSQDWLHRGGFAWDGSWTDWKRWPFSRIELPYPPFVSVTSITYEDGSGVDQALVPGGWSASDVGVLPIWGTSWPSGRVAANAVRIQYQAGYATVPKPIIAAVMLMTADLYANREGQQIDQSRGTAVTNPTVDLLLEPFRLRRV